MGQLNKSCGSFRLPVSLIGTGIGIVIETLTEWVYQREMPANKMFLITLHAAKNTAAIENRFISIMSRVSRLIYTRGVRYTVQNLLSSVSPSPTSCLPPRFHRMHPMALTLLAYRSISAVFVIEYTIMPRSRCHVTYGRLKICPADRS